MQLLVLELKDRRAFLALLLVLVVVVVAVVVALDIDGAIEIFMPQEAVEAAQVVHLATLVLQEV